MSFTFFFDSDDYRKFIRNQRIMKETDLQQRLLCYQCGENHAGVWLRNLQVKNNEGSFIEILLCESCREGFDIPKPLEYVKDEHYEIMPVADEDKSWEIEIE